MTGRVKVLREGFALVGEHSHDCHACRDGEPFVITDTRKPFDFKLKKNAQQRGSTMWWRFVCNDTDCPAILLIRWDQMARLINAEIQP